MSRSGNYFMVTQKQEEMEIEGLDPHNISELARRTNLSRPTVRKYLRDGKIKDHGNKGKRKGSKIDTCKAFLDEQFALGNFNCENLYDSMKERGYSGGKSILKDYVKAFRKPVSKEGTPLRVMRYETIPGDQIQMDWGFLKYTDTKGKNRQVACLVMICGYSRKKYIEFFSCFVQAFLFIGMLHAFIFFGGLPKKILTDNMKSVVTSRGKGGIILNAKYEAFMNDIGFVTKLCKVRCPTTKGKSERLVHYVKNNFMPGRSFGNLVDLNLQALDWCNRVDDKEHGTTHVPPNERFREESFGALPRQSIMDHYLWVSRSIAFDGYISYEGMKFGTSHTCREKHALVSRQANNVIIMDGTSGEVVGTFNVVGKNKVYTHPEQWEPFYRSYSQSPEKKYASGHMTVQNPVFDNPNDFKDYDSLLGGF